MQPIESTPGPDMLPCCKPAMITTLGLESAPHIVLNSCLRLDQYSYHFPQSSSASFFLSSSTSQPDHVSPAPLHSHRLSGSLPRSFQLDDHSSRMVLVCIDTVPCAESWPANVQMALNGCGQPTDAVSQRFCAGLHKLQFII